MILQLTAIDKDGQHRDFFCQPATLETACDIVSTIAAKGDAILAVQLTDETSHISLPPALFDGQSFSEPIGALEKQWQAILDEPARLAVSTDDWHVEVTRRQVRLFEGKIGQFDRIIQQLERLQQRASQNLPPGPARTDCLRHYETLLVRYRRYADRTQTSRQRAVERLEH